MDRPSLTLEQALEGASTAPRDRRIEFRDPLARHGADAIDAVFPWLSDPEMRRFAVRVVVRAAEFGAQLEAKTALSNVLASLTDATAREEVGWGLGELGVTTNGPSGGRRARKQRTVKTSVQPIDHLVVGRLYKRRELHVAGWGGNRQSGVSYPADGDYVMLFSDPGAETLHGYRDGWKGDTYQYFGAWSGSGDMAMTAVNQAILDRSPNLMLLIKVGELHRFEGWFAYARHRSELTTRDGAEYRAIVFELTPRPARP